MKIHQGFLRKFFYYSFILSAFFLSVFPTRSFADSLVGTIPVGAQPSSLVTLGDKVYVVNQTDSTVSIIDTGTFNAVTSVPVGSAPYGITTAGSNVYVASYGNDTVSVIDTANNNTVSTISVGSFPYDIKSLGTKVYVANYFGGTVSVIDTANNNAVSTITVGSGPSALGVLGNKVYVANTDNNTVSIIDTLDNSVTTVAVGLSPTAITAMGTKVYVLNYGDNTVSVIDTFGGNAVSSVTVGINPFAFTALNNKVYVANYSSNTVSIIDTLNHNAVSTIGVETGPYAITALSSLGSKVYVASQAANKVSIIDTLNNNAVTSIAVGSSPSSIAILGDKIYVGNYGSNTVSVIQVELPPTVLSVSSDKVDGTYGTGDIIDVDVTFSEPVTSTGDVTVTLETGATDRTCTFTVTNSNAGTCDYVVQSGDMSADLSVLSIAGSLVDQNGNSMQNFVPTTNLDANKALVINTSTPPVLDVAPTITNISSPKTDGTYGVGETIDVTVTFSEPVTSTGDVTVTLETGATDRTCTFTVTNSDTGTCTYTVQAGDASTDLNVASISGVITDQTNNPMVNFTPTVNLADNKALVIDTNIPVVDYVPTITYVTSSQVDGLYTTGTAIDVTVTFSEPVTSTGDVTVTLETGATDRTCTFTVTNSDTRTCTYTVQAGDASTDLNVASISGVITDQTNNPMVNFTPTVNLADNKALTIDTTAPVLSEVMSISTPSTNVTPSYIFNTTEAGTIVYGGDCASETISAVVGTNNVTFAPLSSGIHSNCTVRVVDSAGNMSSVLSVNTFVIDTDAPIIIDITSTKADGTYGVGTIIPINVTFSEPVTSTGDVTVTPETGATDRTCTFTVSNSTTASCNYTVQSGDTTGDLDVKSVSGVIKDALLNTMTDFVPVANLAGNKALVIGITTPVNTAPVITLLGENPFDFWSPSNSPFNGNGVGANKYNEPGFTATDAEDGNVGSSVVDGAPVLVSTTGPNTCPVKTYTITYTVSDSVGFAASPKTRTVIHHKCHASSDPLYVWGADDNDTADDGPNPALNPAPTIDNITSTKPDGTYGVGTIIPINVTFSEPVTSTGNVTVTLETGAVDRTCTFTVSNSTTASCNYTVQSGDTTGDLDVKSVSGSIKDQMNKAMVNFTPMMNLAFSKEIIIGTAAPTITNITSSKANGTYGAGTVVAVNLTFSQKVTSTGNVTVTLETGTVDRTCTFTVSNSTTASCNYTVQSGDTTGDLDVKSVSGSIKDQNNIPMTNFVPAVNLADNKAIVISA